MKAIKLLVVWLLLAAGAESLFAETTFVVIPAGTYPRKDNAGNVQTITVKSFQMADTLVTIKEWRQFLKETNPASITDWERRVLYQVDSDFRVKKLSDGWPTFVLSWYQAIKYCNWASEKAGLEPVYSYIEKDKGSLSDVRWDIEADGYRLPTEAEWELASGIPTATATMKDYMRHSQLKEKRDSTAGPRDVKLTPANKNGVYDMFGIVNQYCWDYYNEKYYLSMETKDPHGPLDFFYSNSDYPSEEIRVMRGGTWFSTASDLVKTPRRIGYAGNDTALVGFRLAKN